MEVDLLQENKVKQNSNVKCPNPLQCKRTRQMFSLIGTMDMDS
jgi:hypothetical protein